MEPEPAANSGQSGRIFPQNTGVTTIARQFTGAESRYVTGGRLSPTKQLGLGTPTKVAVQFTGGGSKGTIRPRPKSAIGMRGEGRGCPTPPAAPGMLPSTVPFPTHTVLGLVFVPFDYIVPPFFFVC